MFLYQSEFVSSGICDLKLQVIFSSIYSTKANSILEEDKRTQSSGEECVGSYPPVGQHGLNGKLYQK